jgi:hypothetical protein
MEVGGLGSSFLDLVFNIYRGQKRLDSLLLISNFRLLYSGISPQLIFSFSRLNTPGLFVFSSPIKKPYGFSGST